MKNDLIAIQSALTGIEQRLEAMLAEIERRDQMTEAQRHHTGGYYCNNCSKVLCEKQGDICPACRQLFQDARARNLVYRMIRLRGRFHRDCAEALLESDPAIKREICFSCRSELVEVVKLQSANVCEAQPPNQS